MYTKYKNRNIISTTFSNIVIIIFIEFTIKKNYLQRAINKLIFDGYIHRYQTLYF